ncbi:MAG: hypothetical protein K0S32_3698 [Bacteroidetes bacterium]|nr:hypothetical protein [Bacteroidota bacterium]
MNRQQVVCVWILLPSYEGITRLRELLQLLFTCFNNYQSRPRSLNLNNNPVCINFENDIKFISRKKGLRLAHFCLKRAILKKLPAFDLH